MVRFLLLPTLPPLKGGEIVRVEGGLYVLLLERMDDEPSAYKGVPLREWAPVPVDLLVHEDLIEEVVGRISPVLLKIARALKRRPVNFLRDKDEFLREIIAVQWGSEFCLTEPWQRVVCCRKATILITEKADISLLRFSRFGKASVKELPGGELEVVLEAGTTYFTGGYDALPVLITEGADLSLLRFSRFGKASVKELPDGKLEVVLQAGTTYFTGGYDALPDGGVIKKGPSVKLFIEGEEVPLNEDEDLVLYVRGDESLPEARVVF